MTVMQCVPCNRNHEISRFSLSFAKKHYFKYELDYLSVQVIYNEMCPLSMFIEKRKMYPIFI